MPCSVNKLKTASKRSEIFYDAVVLCNC